VVSFTLGVSILTVKLVLETKRLTGSLSKSRWTLKAMPCSQLSKLHAKIMLLTQLIVRVHPLVGVKDLLVTKVKLTVLCPIVSSSILKTVFSLMSTLMEIPVYCLHQFVFTKSNQNVAQPRVVLKSESLVLVLPIQTSFASNLLMEASQVRSHATSMSLIAQSFAKHHHLWEKRAVSICHAIAACL